MTEITRRGLMTPSCWSVIPSRRIPAKKIKFDFSEQGSPGNFCACRLRARHTRKQFLRAKIQNRTACHEAWMNLLANPVEGCGLDAAQGRSRLATRPVRIRSQCRPDSSSNGAPVRIKLRIHISLKLIYNFTRKNEICRNFGSLADPR
jgi:hypothetical protein